MRVFVSVLLLAASLSFGACAKRPQIRDFAHRTWADHPLVGRIWDGQRGRWVTRRTLQAAVREHSMLLLGESHDNVDHHRIQAALLALWIETHPEGRVAFEQLNETQGRALTAHPPRTADDVRRISRWERTGWPDFALYEPLFSLAVDQPGGPVAAHPSPDTLRAAMGSGPDSLPADLALMPEPPPPVMEALRQEIVDAHCGHAPGELLEPMALAQRLKDAWMARAMAQSGAPAMALVAGAGHVRRDRGVPLYLARQGEPEVLSIAMLPVHEDADAPADYGAAAYDFVVFTPATTSVSACERFREQLERMQHPQPAAAPPPGSST